MKNTAGGFKKMMIEKHIKNDIENFKRIKKTGACRENITIGLQI